jgi:hypothetical protein
VPTRFNKDTCGQRTTGRVADLSPSSLVVVVPDARTFAENAVTEIRGPDTLRSGALKPPVVVQTFRSARSRMSVC